MAPVISAGLMDVEPGLIFWTLVTFGCLFFLLRWKAWGPILRAVEQREKTVSDAVASAKHDREEAAALLTEHRKLITDARREGAEMVRKAMEAAEASRSEVLAKSRKEAEEIATQAKRQIEDQVLRAKTDLRTMVVDLAMDAAEKVVGEALADPAKQRKLVEQYVRDFDSH